MTSCISWPSHIFICVKEHKHKGLSGNIQNPYCGFFAFFECGKNLSTLLLSMCWESYSYDSQLLQKMPGKIEHLQDGLDDVRYCFIPPHLFLSWNSTIILLCVERAREHRFHFSVIRIIFDIWDPDMILETIHESNKYIY